MRTGKIKRAGIFLLLFTAVFSVRIFAASATHTVTMKQVGNGKYTNTVRIGNQKYIYHKIRVKTAGFICFSAKTASGTAGSDGLVGNLFSSDGKRESRKAYPGGSRYVSIRKKEDAYYSVGKGTYYFRVSTLGMSGCTYRLNAVFAKKIRENGKTKSTAATLKAGRSRSGMFWFDGFGGQDNYDEKYHWFRFRAKAGKRIKVLYWSSYYAPDLFFSGESGMKINTELKKKNGKTSRIYTVMTSMDGWVYLRVLGFTCPGQEKMYTLTIG